MPDPLLKVFHPCYTEEAKRNLIENLTLPPGRSEADVVRHAEATLAQYLDVPPSWVILTNSCTAAMEAAFALRPGAENLGPASFPICTWPSTYSWHDPTRRLFYDNVFGTEQAIDRASSGSAFYLVNLHGKQLPEAYFTELYAKSCWTVLDAAHRFGEGMALLQRGVLNAVCYSFDVRKEVPLIRGGALVAPLLHAYRRRIEEMLDSGTYRRKLRTTWDRNRVVGRNHRMDACNAGMLEAQLRKACEWWSIRQDLLTAYELELTPDVMMTLAKTHSGHMAVARLRTEWARSHVVAALDSHCIAHSHHYHIPAALGYDFNRLVQEYLQWITLPCHVGMTVQDVERVCHVIKAAAQL